MKFDIPINFTVEAKTEQEAENFLHKNLDSYILKNGLGELIEFENFEFITTESCSSGEFCGS